MHNNTAYDGTQIPPNFGICLNHEKACRPRPTNPQMPLCPCCSQRISEATYSMDVDLSRITNKIGLGTVTLFQHLKVYIYMTVAIFVLYGIPNLITNFLGEYCGKSATTPTAIRCRNDFITATSFLNKIGEDLYVDIQGFSGIVTTATLLVIYYYQRFTLRFCYSEVMISNLKSVKLSAKSSDFTLMAKHLPPERYTVQELEQQLHHYYDEVYKSSLNRPTLELYTVVAYDLVEHKKNQHQMKLNRKILNKIAYYQKQKGHANSYPKGHDRTSHTKAQTLYDQSSLRHHGLQKIIDLGTFCLLQASIMYVKHNNISEEKAFFEQEYQYSTPQRLMNQLRLWCGASSQKFLSLNRKAFTLVEAVEPSDVIWGNCGTSSYFRSSQKLLVVLITLILIALNFMVIYYITIEQQRILRIAEETISWFSNPQYFSVLICLMIALVNALVFVAVEHLGKLPQFETQTSLALFKIHLLSAIMFLNTIFLPVFVNFAVYLVHLDAFQKDIVNGLSGGLIYDLFYVSASQGLITIIMDWLNPGYIVQFFRRRSARKISNLLNQAEANKIFEGSEFCVYQSWSNANIIVWINALYCPLMPQVTVFSLVAILLYYQQQKFLLLRRYKKPKNLSSQIKKVFLQSEYILMLLFAMGISVTKLMIFIQTNSFDDLIQFRMLDILYIFPLFLVLLCLILNYLYNVCCFSTRAQDFSQNESTLDYFQLKDKFIEDYDRENPCTKEKANKNMLTKIPTREDAPFVDQLQEQIKDQVSLMNITYDI